MGHRIDLTIHDNIPYVDLGTADCSPRDCCISSRILSCLIMDVITDDNVDDIDDIGRVHGRVHLDGSSGYEIESRS